MRSLIRIF